MIHDHCTPQVPRKEIMPLGRIERDLVDAMLQSLMRLDAVVEQVVAGPKFIAVITGGRMGMSSLLGARPAGNEADMTEKSSAGRPPRSLSICCASLPLPSVSAWLR